MLRDKDKNRPFGQLDIRQSNVFHFGLLKGLQLVNLCEARVQKFVKRTVSSFTLMNVSVSIFFLTANEEYCSPLFSRMRDKTVTDRSQ